MIRIMVRATVRVTVRKRGKTERGLLLTARTKKRRKRRCCLTLNYRRHLPLKLRLTTHLESAAKTTEKKLERQMTKTKAPASSSSIISPTSLRRC